MRGSRTCVVAVVAFVVAAGCQREISTREYVEQADAAAADVVKVLDQLEQSDSPAPDPATVLRLADELDGAVDDLKAIDPPERAAAAHQRLERSVGSLAESVRAMQKQLAAATDNSKRLAVITAWSSSQATTDALNGIDTAITALDRNGYDLTTQKQPAS